MKVQNGIDVVGEIAKEGAIGRGQVLTGRGGFGSKAEGISIRYSGETAPPAGQRAGTLTFTQNSLSFQIGSNSNQTTRVSFKSSKAQNLGTGVDNDSGFRSFAEINLMSAPGARDSIDIIDKAINDVAANRGYMGAFQKNTLELSLIHI